MNFDIDPSDALREITEALEEAGSQLSEDQFVKIANAIESGMPGVIQTIAQGTAQFWKSEASGKGGWGEKYAQAVKYEVTGTKAEVFVDETLKDPSSNKSLMMFANMVENGVKSWSIKDALMQSDKVKTSSTGIKYIVIPFPVATPRKASAGKGRSQFGGREMTQEMYKIVKSGGKLGSGSVKAGARDVNISGLSRYKTQKLHGQYGIFRMVSEKSQGWIHPGKSSDPVYPEVLEFVNKQINEMLSAYCKAIVQEYSK
jgi:hypothetical protein